MLVAAAHAVPYVHEDGTAFAIGVGVATLLAAGLATTVAFTRPARVWRWSWLLTTGLCVLLAVDETFPLTEWITHATGLRWWKLYALPVALGLLGWLGAAWLLAGELSWTRRPVRLLLLGELAWASAYGIRLIVFFNDHGGLNSYAVRQTGLMLEAACKVAGSALLIVALVEARDRLGASNRLQPA